jgi:hypothetical protein
MLVTGDPKIMLQAVDNLDVICETKQLVNIQDVMYENVKTHDPQTTHGIAIVSLYMKRWQIVNTRFVYTAGKNVSLDM